MPEVGVALVEAQIDLVEDLSDIDPIGDPSGLLQLLIVGLMQKNPIWVASFHEVQDLLADQHDAFIPFALNIVGSFMVYGSEDLSGGQDAISEKIVRIEVGILLAELEIDGLTHLGLGRFQYVRSDFESDI